MKIAIIGSGISGLTCAYLLDKQQQLTLFEKNDYFGGHAHTATAEYQDKLYALDTGFLVYNEPGYPGFTKLLKKLGVNTIASDMSFSVSHRDPDFEYNGNNLTSLFAQKRNLFNPYFYGMLKDILKFNRLIKALIQTQTTLSLQAFIDEHRFGRYFTEYYLRPMLAAIWSMKPNEVLNFPVLFLGKFFDNHGLLNVSNRPQWRTISGGSKQYVAAIMKSFSGAVIQQAVTEILRLEKGYQITDQNHQIHYFDAVIIATHSDEALSLYPTMPAVLREALQHIPYQPNEVILHTDETVMPKRKAAWASWNYLLSKNNERSNLTYYINRLQNIDAPCSFLVTLNQSAHIEPSKILQRFEYAHPIFNQQTLSAQQVIQQHNGTDQLYLCGAYLGNGFHEDGLQSALKVCQRLGIDEL
jgi:predicted NAD/FAD-binding protein